MKKLLVIVLLSSFLIADKLKDVKQLGVLKAGVKYDFEPFGFKDEDGKVVGFDIDLLEYIGLKYGWVVQYQQVTSKNRIDKVANGEIDIAAASMTHKVSRDANIDFTISYFFDGQSFLVRKNCKKRRATGFNGKYVAAIEGSTSGNNLRKIAPKAQVVYFKTYPEAVEALRAGKVDAVTTDLVWCSAQAKNSDGAFKVLNDVISFEPYGMGVPENESDFRDAINFALQDAVRDGTYQKLYLKWFGKDPERLPEVWPK